MIYPNQSEEEEKDWKYFQNQSTLRKNGPLYQNQAEVEKRVFQTVSLDFLVTFYNKLYIDSSFIGLLKQ